MSNEKPKIKIEFGGKNKKAYEELTKNVNQSINEMINSKINTKRVSIT